MSLRHLILAAAVALPAMTASAAMAAEEHIALKQVDWPTNGIFGSFDRAAAQRGFQVYREVCAACHGLEFVAFRNLATLGYSEDDIKAFAAELTVTWPVPDRAGRRRRAWRQGATGSVLDGQGASRRTRLHLQPADRV